MHNDFQDEMQAEALNDLPRVISLRSQRGIGYGDPTKFALDTEVRITQQEHERQYQERTEDYSS